MDFKINTVHDKNEWKIYDVLDQTALICKQEHLVDSNGLLVLEWNESGDSMHMRDLKKYIEIFSKRCFFKSDYKMDSFTRRLKTNDFKQNPKLTAKVHSSEISHEHFKRKSKGEWSKIRTIVTRPVKNGASEMTTIDPQVLENFKNDTAKLRNTVEKLQKDSYQMEGLALESKALIHELTIKNQEVTEKLDLFESENRKQNEKAYEIKKELEINGYEGPALKSSEFGITECRRKIIQKKVEVNHNTIKHNYESAVSPSDSAISVNSDHARVRNRNPSLSQNSKPDDASNTTVVPSPSKKQLKRPTFRDRSVEPEKRSKNTQPSDLAQMEVISSDFRSPPDIKNPESNPVDSKPGVFSTEFSGIVDEIYDMKQN